VEALTGKQKAAVLMLALGPDLAAKVLKHVSKESFDQLSVEIFNTKVVPAKVQEAVLTEASTISAARAGAISGPEAARSLFSKALGEAKAGELMDKLSGTDKDRPFAFADACDPSQLVMALKNESPQTIALVLSYLEPKKSTAVLSQLPVQQQSAVAARIAVLGGTSRTVVQQVEQGLRKKLDTGDQSFVVAGGVGNLMSVLGGVDKLVAILKVVDPDTEKSIMNALEASQPKLAEQVRARMFTFEDLASLDDRAVQRLLREADSKDLALALRSASDVIKGRIFKNMSSRSAEMLNEELSLSGPVRMKTVKEAQQRITDTLVRLAESREIYIPRGEEEEGLV
jgi:flagellar motor switch protein FliG